MVVGKVVRDGVLFFQAVDLSVDLSAASAAEE